jgi:Arc/MetJ-type ribon-helix-helix transcriptional regulator
MQHQISLPKNYSDRLKAAANKDGISKSEVVRRALDALEEQQARKDRVSGRDPKG